jgi:hypothetical protein
MKDKILIIYHKLNFSSYSLKKYNYVSYGFIKHNDNNCWLLYLPQAIKFDYTEFSSLDDAIKVLHKSAIDEGYVILTKEKYEKLSILK